MHYARELASEQPGVGGGEQQGDEVAGTSTVEAWDSAVRHVLEGWANRDGWREEKERAERADDGPPSGDPNTLHPAFEPRGEIRTASAGRLLTDELCLTVNLYSKDYDAGWSGAILSFGAYTSINTGETIYSGFTILSGYQASYSVCKFGCGCYLGAATLGNLPECTECNSWDVKTADGTIVAQAMSNGVDKFCFGDCLVCDAGNYSNVEGTACIPCPVGRYNDAAGQFASWTCTKCGVGKYNEHAGSALASDCLDCELGAYSAVWGAAICSKCERGSFTDAPAMTSCSWCAADSYSGSISEEDCVGCAVGEYGDSAQGKCLSCSAASGNQCIIALTKDLDEAYERSLAKDTILLTPGSKYTGSEDGCTYNYQLRTTGSAAICVLKVVVIKCSDTEQKCELTLVTTVSKSRGIMFVNAGENANTGKGVTLEGLSFSNGQGQYSGGAIVFKKSAGVSIISCRFDGNKALYSGSLGEGGALYFDQCPGATILFSTFSGNSAGSEGGAIEFTISSGATILSSTFSGNSAGYGGGAIKFTYSTGATITSCIFNLNSASGEESSGGAIKLGESSSATFVSSTFSDNSRARWAGAIVIDSSCSLCFWVLSLKATVRHL